MVPTFSPPASWASKSTCTNRCFRSGRNVRAIRGQRIVIGMQIACDEATGHRLIGGSLNLARTEYPGRIPIEQQAQQHFGSVGFPTACSIVGIQRREVQLSHTVYHKAR